MKKVALFSIMTFISLTLFGCGEIDPIIEPPVCDPENPTPECEEEPPPDPTPVSVVEAVSATDGVDLYADATLSVGGSNIPIYEVKTNSAHKYVYPNPPRESNGYAIVRLKGVATFTLTTNYVINYTTRVMPKEYNIIPTHNIAQRTISFEISNPGQYVIEPNKDPQRTIHLFVDDLKTPDPEIDFDSPNVLYFPKGVHSQYNNALINSSDRLVLNSNQILYLDYGAQLNATVYANNVTNIKILGGGVISGASLNREQSKVPINIERSSNIEIQGISIIDPAAWTLNLYFCHDVTIHNIKIISSRANGDGITLQSCQRVITTNSFVRGFDDNLVVKNYTDPYGNRPGSLDGYSEDILFKDCLLWTDLAQSMEIGFETVHNYIKDVVFDNITVLHNFHKPVISIHNGNNALVSDIIFKNITVDLASMGGGDAGMSRLIDFVAQFSNDFSNKPTQTSLPIGDIENITVDNILVREVANTTTCAINIAGWKDNRSLFAGDIAYVRDVQMLDIKIVDTVLGSNYQFLTTNEYTSNITLTKTGEEITGAQIARKYTIEEIREFRKKLEINII